jgi:ATP adenylyltransferase
MAYVGGGAREDGCVFCSRLASTDDVASLIVYRGEAAFVILNLYPYNTGHVMIVPNAHVQNPDALEPNTLAEMAALVATLTAGLRYILRCDGFNVGMNIGGAAGAGIAEHLHQHVVPRWLGDANFMPIVGSTNVLPETLPATYAKLRAEFARETSRATRASAVVFDRSLRSALMDGDKLPAVPLDAGIPVWRSLVNALGPRLPTLQVAGWAGPAAVADDADDDPALAFIVDSHAVRDGSVRMTPVADEALSELPERSRRLIARARQRLASA